MTDIKSMTMEELTHTLREMGQPAFRGGQVFTWLHRGVTSFEEMSDLPRALREQLAQTFHITAPTVARKQESRLDGTVKYRQLHRDGAHAVSPRQHRVHLLSGGLPHGLRLLRQHHRRKGP